MQHLCTKSSKTLDTQQTIVPNSLPDILYTINERLNLLDIYYIKNDLKNKQQTFNNIKLKDINDSMEKEIFLFSEKYKRPDNSFQNLLQTLYHIGDHSTTELIYAYILLERYLEMTKIRGPVNLYSLYKIAVFITNKFLDEKSNWEIGDYCNLVDMEKKTAFLYEQLFLKAIGYKIFISVKIFKDYKKYLYF